MMQSASNPSTPRFLQPEKQKQSQHRSVPPKESHREEQPTLKKKKTVSFDGEFSTKQLTMKMLTGKTNEVLDFLRSLPREEMDTLRLKLVRNIEKLQKRAESKLRRDKSSDSFRNSTSNLAQSSSDSTLLTSSTDSSPTGSLSGKPSPQFPRSSSSISQMGAGGLMQAFSMAPSMSPLARRKDGQSNINAQPMQPPMITLSASERANIELAGKYVRPVWNHLFIVSGPTGFRLTRTCYPSTQRIGEVLGKGGFGTVLKAVSVENGSFVAIKQIDKELVDDSQLPSVMHEADILKKLNHPNIEKIYGIIETKTSLYFILEFVESGSLASLIKKYGVFPEPLIAIYVEQTLRGLDYLHGCNIVHRDIKGDNILITKEGRVKLADFGTAKFEDTDKKSQNVVGTPYWMAPEVIELQPNVGPKSDIWSLGCTVIELITGTPPYFDLGPMTALFKIVEDELPPLPDGLSPSLKDFLVQSFDRNPDKRPTAKQLLSHPFITEHVKDSNLALDLEQATGTIRMHNQGTVRRKPAIFDLSWDHSKDVIPDSTSASALNTARGHSDSVPNTARGLSRATSVLGGGLRRATSVLQTMPEDLTEVTQDRERVAASIEQLTRQVNAIKLECDQMAREERELQTQLDKTLSQKQTFERRRGQILKILSALGVQVEDLKSAEKVLEDLEKRMGPERFARLLRAVEASKTKAADVAAPVSSLRRSRSLGDICK